MPQQPHHDGRAFNGGVGSHNDCASGKVAFTSRRAAKQALGRGALRGQHLRPYRCEPGCGFWHNGHIPSKVMRGRTSARAYYGREANTDG